ncbi:hypothetical protein JCM8547_007586 [Rhodosporidiobolus lusitaniae]
MSDDLFQQLFESTGGSLDQYLNLAAPLDAATLSLAGDPAFAALPLVSPSSPLNHGRQASGSTSSSSVDVSCIAPVDLSPSQIHSHSHPHPHSHALPPSNASSRRPSGEQAAPDSPGSDKSAGSGKAGGSSTGGSGKKQKKSPAPEEGEGKKKKTRNRKPSSCAACRKRKLRCNRADPCDQCTAKGEAHLCDWEGAEPLYKVRTEADTQELKDQVARLESLVRYLTSQRRDDDPVDSSVVFPDEGASPHNSVVQFPSKHTKNRQYSGSQASQPPTPRNASFAMDLRANDLCEGLGQLAIKEFVVVEGSGGDAWAPGGTRGLEFVEEAKQFLATMPQQFGVAQAPAFSIPNPNKPASVPSTTPSLSEPAGSPSRSDAASSPASILSPSPLGTASFGKEAPPLSDVLKFLPTHKQAMSAYTYFAGYVSWYAHPVHLATFEQQWKDLQAALAIEDEELRNKAIDPFFIATFLGVLATGLAMMPVKRAVRDGFFSEEEKDKMVDKWLEGAMVALTCGRFLDNPSVEAVRASVVLGTFFVFVSTGERSGAGMGLLSLVVQIALSLGLHRDPDRTPGRYTFFEAEERRRLFWNLFMLCILSSASLSRTWAVFDLNGVDTRLPLDCHDHEILDEATAMAGIEKRKARFEETPMTSLLCKMKLAVLARKMNDRAFGIHPVPYEEILALDAELKELEEGIPARYKFRLDPSGALIRPSAHVTVTEMRACMVQISLAGEFLRLHRPWLLLAANDPRYQYSRNQAVHWAKLLLAVYRSPSCSKARWGGISYKATNAAIVLAIDALAFPDGSEVSLHRSIVNAVFKQLDSQAPFSSLCRKGSRVLRFLLDKEASLAAQRDQRRQLKRSRVDDTTAFPSRGLRNVLDTSSVAQPQFMLDRDYRDDEYLPHKGDMTDYFSAIPSHSYPTQDLHQSTSAQARLPPLPLPRGRAPPPPPVTIPAAPSVPTDTVPNSIDAAGNFSFDFYLPPPTAAPYASPAPTVYPSPYGAQPPVYQQPPGYTSQPSSASATPLYSLPAPPPAQSSYPVVNLDTKAAPYSSGAISPTFVLPRY